MNKSIKSAVTMSVIVALAVIIADFLFFAAAIYLAYWLVFKFFPRR